MAKEGLWTRTFVVAFASRLLTSAVFTLLNATIAAYALVACDVDAGLAGIAAGAFILSSVIARVVVGRFTDRIGRRSLIVASGVLMSLATCAYLLPCGIGALVAVRCLHGVAHGVSSNTITTVVVDAIPERRMGEGLGYLNLSTAFATAIGPFSGILLLQNAWYEEMFLLCAALTIAGFALCLVMDVKEVPRGAVSVDDELASGLAGYFEAKALPLSVAVFALCVCSSCVTAFLSPCLDDAGVAWAAPWFFVVYAFAMAASRLLLGRCMDRAGDNAVAYPLLALFALGLAVLSGLSVPEVFLSAVLLAFGYGGLFPCFQAIAVRGIPSERLSVATSTFFALTDAGLGIGPMVGGAVALHVGYSGCFLVCCGVALFCAFLYWALHGRINSKRRV